MKLCHVPFLFIFSEKRETEKPIVTASSPIAIGCTHFVHSVPKNDKLAMLKQCRFLNGTPFSSLASVDATKKDKAVTYLINVKATRFHPYFYTIKVKSFYES